MPFPLANSALFQAGALALLLLAVATQAPPAEAASVHKCIINGSVTYQGSPCPPEAARTPATVARLNAERRARPAQAGTRAASPPAAKADSDARPPARASLAASPVLGLNPGPAMATTAATPTAPRPSAYSCDGRTRCAQMRSCAEARFFLANCPGVQMDGNRDGLPCERQWCKR